MKRLSGMAVLVGKDHFSAADESTDVEEMIPSQLPCLIVRRGWVFFCNGKGFGERAWLKRLLSQSFRIFPQKAAKRKGCLVFGAN